MVLQAALGRVRLAAAAACFLLGAFVLLVGFLPGLWRQAPATADPALAFAAFDPPATTGPVELVVYITGAVARPDVYRLAPGSRVKDAVLAAGGFRPDAAAEQINLAEPLSDAAHVHIPAFVSPAAPALPDRPATADPALVDLNTAGAAELEELPGIGATLASRIVERRTNDGPFTAVEQLREVSGVGERLYAQIAPLVTVEP